MAAALLGAGAHWTAAFGGQAIGTWLGGGTRSCECSCRFEASPDEALVGLLKGQLDRCGPEHLHGQPAVAPACPPVGHTFLELLLVLVIGVVLGVLLRELFVALCRRSAVPASAELNGGGADGEGLGEPPAGRTRPRLLRSNRQLLA